MTLVPNSSLGIQNTSSLLTGSLHLRERTVRDPDRPHVVDSRPRIDHTWLITVWTRHMEKSPSEYDSFTPCQLETQDLFTIVTYMYRNDHRTTVMERTTTTISV